jgi:enoyl-CoA hydratase/carnithine racemase
MSKPTAQELAEALELAKQMREQGKDTHFIAKSLLSHHYRIGYLEEVLYTVERYLRSGMSENEHRRLLKALDKARQAEARTAKEIPEEGLGLG